MPAPAEIQARTLNDFLDGWKKWTPEAWTASWSDECTQRLLPFTLGVPPKSLPEARDTLGKMMPVLMNYQVDFYEIIHDAAKGKAAIYATSKADTPFGDFKWTNEYAVFLTFTEDGEKVMKMEEMVDTAFFRDFSPKFQKYLSEQQASVSVG